MQQVGEGLVLADDHADRARIALGGGAERVLEPGVAGADQGELPAEARDQRQGVEDKVQALLAAEAADDAEQQRIGRRIEAEALLQGGLVGGAARHVARRIGRRDVGVVRRVPQGVVDAVAQARHRGGAGAQQPVEAHAALVRHDLGGIGRRHRGDVVRIEQRGLEEAQRAVELGAFGAEGLVGQAQAVRHPGREPARKGEVVDRRHGAGLRVLREVQVGRREARLPVMAVDDVGPVVGDQAGPDPRRDEAQRAETGAVVRPFRPVGRQIRIAGPIVEMRGVDGEEVEPSRPAGEDACRAAEQVGDLGRDRGTVERTHHGGIAGHQGADRDALARQRGRQRADDVGETARLHQRGHLGHDGQDLDGLQPQQVVDPVVALGARVGRRCRVRRRRGGGRHGHGRSLETDGPKGDRPLAEPGGMSSKRGLEAPARNPATGRGPWEPGLRCSSGSASTG